MSVYDAINAIDAINSIDEVLNIAFGKNNDLYKYKFNKDFIIEQYNFRYKVRKPVKI